MKKQMEGFSVTVSLPSKQVCQCRAHIGFCSCEPPPASQSKTTPTVIIDGLDVPSVLPQWGTEDGWCLWPGSRCQCSGGVECESS